MEEQKVEKSDEDESPTTSTKDLIKNAREKVCLLLKKWTNSSNKLKKLYKSLMSYNFHKHDGKCKDCTVIQIYINYDENDNDDDGEEEEETEEESEEESEEETEEEDDSNESGDVTGKRYKLCCFSPENKEENADYSLANEDRTQVNPDTCCSGVEPEQQVDPCLSCCCANKM